MHTSCSYCTNLALSIGLAHVAHLWAQTGSFPNPVCRAGLAWALRAADTSNWLYAVCSLHKTTVACYTHQAALQAGCYGSVDCILAEGCIFDTTALEGHIFSPFGCISSKTSLAPFHSLLRTASAKLTTRSVLLSPPSERTVTKPLLSLNFWKFLPLSCTEQTHPLLTSDGDKLV